VHASFLWAQKERGRNPPFRRQGEKKKGKKKAGPGPSPDLVSIEELGNKKRKGKKRRKKIHNVGYRQDNEEKERKKGERSLQADPVGWKEKEKTGGASVFSRPWRGKREREDNAEHDPRPDLGAAKIWPCL